MFWVALFVLGGGGTAIFVSYTNRQEIKRHFESLLRSGFRARAKLVVRGGVIIAFDDEKREIAFITSNGATRLPYSYIQQWKALPRQNMSAQLTIYTLDTNCPLYTFDIDTSAMDYVVATINAHVNRPADD